MGLFTAGNLLTLGIALLMLILYRQMDRNSRNLKLIRDYSERAKKELAEYVEGQASAIKDYGVALEVEKDSARELMKRLQITEEELAEKAAAVARIDSQIKGYGSSLSELDRMTGRVQENLNRIRDESAFVENAAKRLVEAKSRLDELAGGLEGLESKFARENSESLGKAAGAMVADVKSEVAELKAAAEAAGRRVEEQYKEIRAVEEARAANAAREMDHVNKILKTAVEEAGKRADKMEEAALANLKEQAEDRLRRLKTAEEEKLRTYQENAKARVAEVQNYIKNFREEWRAERAEWEAKDKSFRDERKKDAHDLSALFAESEKRFGAAQKDIEKRMEDLSAKTEKVVSSQEETLLRAAEEMQRNALESSGAKLEEYRRAQEAEFRRLETLADDSRKLDAELRRSMQEAIGRVKEDFSLYERESADAQKAEAGKFAAAAAALRADMDGMEKDLAALKSAAYENVSEKLKVFEDDFFADLSKRSGDIDKRLVEWQENLETRLAQIAETAETGRRELERGLSDEMRGALSAQRERLVSELDHLKAEASAFEEAIRGRISAADESAISYKEQLEQGLEEARREADVFIKAEIGKHSLAAAEAVKQCQRDLEGKLAETAERSQTLADTIEDARRRVRDLSAETDARIAAVRASVDDAERHIREAVDQAKLIDRAEELRLEMERRIEDLTGDMDRLEQRRAETAQLENDFVKIKRLEDDVNKKMTRFISEKRRIETMEADFNRLLQVSRAVDEKLAQVTASDDTLQAVQLQIRKLEEALGTTEEKFQRLERKSQILDNTNDGIDRNFRALQDSEKLSGKIGGDLDRYAEDLDSMKGSIEKLAAQSEKAGEAAGKIDALDDILEEIEERIKSMQRTRQWIADAETRLEDLNRQAQTQARAIDSLVKGKGAKAGVPLDLGEGAPSQQKKENVIVLARKGWTKEEIAKTMKISLGEVELILEMAPRD